MTMQSSIESKNQIIKLKINDLKSAETAIRVIKYHAISIESVKMARRTAQSINKEFVPARPPSIPNPFINDVTIDGVIVDIDDSISAGVMIVYYERDQAINDEQISRKLAGFILK